VVLFYRMKKKNTILNQASPHKTDGMTNIKVFISSVLGQKKQ
jgi:hypothetical protein